MDVTQLSIIAIAIYFLILFIIAYIDNKAKCEQNFIIGSRNVGIIPILSSMTASVRDGTGLAYWIGIGFALGYGYFTLVLGMAIGVIFFTMIAPKIREHSLKYNYITVGQMIKTRVGNKTAVMTSTLILILMFMAIAGQFFVLGYSMAAILGISPVVSTVVTALIILIYLYEGGYNTVVKTDVLQFFMILALISTVFFIPIKIDDMLDIKTLFFDKWGSLTMFVAGFILPFAQTDFYQKIFSAKSNNTLKKSIPLIGPFFILMTLSLVWIGMSARNLIPADTHTDAVLFEILKNNVLPSWIVVLLSLASVSMIMSTIDTYTYVFSSTLLEDFKKIDIVKEKKKYIKHSRVAMIVLLIVGCLVALNITDLIQYVFGVGSLTIVLAPLYGLIGSGFVKKTKHVDLTIAIGLIVSIITFFVVFVLTGLSFLPWLMLPAIVMFLFILTTKLHRLWGKLVG